ncbi:ABC transporter permease [Pyrobaculum neutrophilum]|uniref:ABC-2 type transporter n=1 Tax=Pyrobaculum neutrophilum (strain DSM 2338 / JCM 9278 / NBRC 100436 / V24Sta) TaxID=444157 RepID=B1YDZ7_PYRNV|nr:ABC transporter permease [Pyrobaculum neutrophilum]ACB40010.1 ABC-2 type transporter [Pyrobaculum neutrophilum V24Sta]
MKAIRDALVIAWVNGWIAAVRGWVWVLANAATPLSFLAILGVYGGVDGLRWGLAGGLVWTVASNGISLIGDAAYYRLAIRYQSMLVAAPVSPAGYALGLALSSFVFSLPSLAVYAAAALWLGVNLLAPQAAYAFVMLWLASAGVGFTLSSLVKHMRYAWSLPQILSTVFTVAAPVYYSATLLPSPYLGLLLPTGAAAVIIQEAAGLANYGLGAPAAAALAAQSALGLYSLFKLARWREP